MATEASAPSQRDQCLKNIACYITQQLVASMDLSRFLSNKDERRCPEDKILLINWRSHAPGVLRTAVAYSELPPDRDAQVQQLHDAMLDSFNIASAYNRPDDIQYMFQLTVAALRRQWQKTQPGPDISLAGSMPLPEMQSARVRQQHPNSASMR